MTCVWILKSTYEKRFDVIVHPLKTPNEKIMTSLIPTGTESGEAVESTEGIKAVAKGDQGDSGPRAGHGMYEAPLASLHVEDFG